MSEYQDKAFHFEAVKLHLKHDKNGHVLTLAIHPQDTPDEILRSPVGQRYMVALVAIDDREQPIVNAKEDEGAKALRFAAALCRKPLFQGWICQRYEMEVSEDHAATAMCTALGIESRAELKSDAKARQKLRNLYADYANWTGEPGYN